MAVVRAAYFLGQRNQKVRDIPCIFDMLPENNVRVGYLEHEDSPKLAESCAKVGGAWMSCFFALANLYAWRSGELLGLKLSQIDLLGNVIRLDPGTTKNKAGRTVSLEPEVWPYVVACMVGKKPTDYLLTSEGKPIAKGRFRLAWQRATTAVNLGHYDCRKCGTTVDSQRFCPTCGCRRKLLDVRYGGLLAHDLRRSGNRPLRLAGADQQTVKLIGGWKTDAVFARYSIVSVDDTKSAFEKLRKLREAQEQIKQLEAQKAMREADPMLTSSQTLVRKLPS